MTKIASISIDKIIGEADPVMLAIAGVSDTFSSSDMSKFLSDNKDADGINIDVNTNGGSTDQAYAIHDLLVNCGKEIATRSLKANSSGTIIMLAGKNRSVTKNAPVFIHNTRIAKNNLPDIVTADIAKDLSKELDAEDAKLLNFYASKLSWDEATKNEISALMKSETNIGADGALKFGFATNIINGSKTDAELVPFTWTNKIAAIYKSNHIDMTKIVTKEEYTSGIGKLFKTLASMAKHFKLEMSEDGEVKEVDDAGATETKLKDGGSAFCTGEIGNGVSVFSDADLKTAMKDGDYTAEDGDTFSVKDGVITVFKDADAEASTKKLEDENKKLKEEADAKKAETEDLKKQFIAVAKELTILKKFVPGEDENGSKKNRFENMVESERVAHEAFLQSQKFKA